MKSTEARQSAEVHRSGFVDFEDVCRSRNRHRGEAIARGGAFAGAAGGDGGGRELPPVIGMADGSADVVPDVARQYPDRLKRPREGASAETTGTAPGPAVAMGMRATGRADSVRSAAQAAGSGSGN